MMKNTPAAIRFTALIALALLLNSCGGCGNCNVPAFNATAAPGATFTPPAGIPTPTLPPAATPTPASLACTQGAGAIPLGPALSPFAVLAGSAISNVGLSIVSYAPGAVTGTIHDDLIGVWPGTAITGFYPPGTDTDGPAAIYGAGYDTNAAVPQAAQNALTTAYNAAAGAAATATVAGDLSQASVPGYPTGTLPAGVYHASSSVSIATGNLTLDGGGNPNSVFIFQIASTLTTTFNGVTSGNMLLIHGASPCNVYWQIGSSATLGGATFDGNIFAYSSITINSASFTGRALAGGSGLGDGAVSIPLAAGSLITNPGGN
jgi:hypothetical protein